MPAGSSGSPPAHPRRARPAPWSGPSLGSPGPCYGPEHAGLSATGPVSRRGQGEESSRDQACLKVVAPGERVDPGAVGGRGRGVGGPFSSEYLGKSFSSGTLL